MKNGLKKRIVYVITFIILLTQNEMRAQDKRAPFGSADKQIEVTSDEKNGLRFSIDDDVAFKFGYLEYLPLGFDKRSDKKYPLILFFHGGAEPGLGTNSLPYCDLKSTEDSPCPKRKDINKLSIPKLCHDTIIEQCKVQKGLGKFFYRKIVTCKENNGNRCSIIRYSKRKADPPSIIANGSDILRSHYSNAIVISVQQRFKPYPKGFKNGAWVPPYISEKIYNWIVENYKKYVDKDRVYLTGFSAGANAALRFLNYRPDIPAAVLVYEPAGEVKFTNPKVSDVPVWIHRSTRSDITNQSIKTVDFLAKMYPNVPNGSVYDHFPKDGNLGDMSSNYTCELLSDGTWSSYYKIVPSFPLSSSEGRFKGNLIHTSWAIAGHKGWDVMYRRLSVLNWLYGKKRKVKVSSTHEDSIAIEIKNNTVVIKSTVEIQKLSIYNFNKKLIRQFSVSGKKEIRFKEKVLKKGMYVFQFKTTRGILSKKIFIK